MVIALGLTESVVPEHPSAMLASVSSRVGRSVGWSDDFSAHEKQHEFSRHEHESSHEQHDFSQHGHDFSREQHEQTHVEQSQLPHVCGNTLGESAVGQSSCDSSGVQLVGQSSCGSSEVQLVGQSPCGSSEVQLVGRLPARVVELLQSSAVGKPCQDRRLCQDHVGTPSSSGPTTSSGLGPTLGAQGSLRGFVSESELLQQSACVHGRSVGRSVGRAEGQLQSPVGRAEVQLQSPVGRAEGQLQSPVGRAEVQLQSPVGCAEESLQLNVAAQSPLKARVGRSRKGAQSRATLGDGGYEGTCEMGATVAACAGDLVHDESPEMVTEDSAMAKAPPGTTEDPAMVEEVGSEDELEDITPVMEEIWTPPYHVPESTWSVPGPLDHAQTPHYTCCLLCEKWCSAGHLMSAGHSTAIQKWMQSGKPVLKIPPRFAEDEQVEMLIQSRHPTWSRRTILAAKQAILQMAYYRAQEGTFRGEIPPEMDENLKKVLEEVREHPHQPVVHGVGRRSMGELARLSGKQPPRQKAKVEPSPVLQPPMPVPAEVPPLPAPVEAPPLGVPLPIQPPLPPPSTAAPTYSWTPTPAPRVGAVYSTPSGQSYRVREELGLLSEAEKEAWRIALNQARQVRPRVASRSLPMPPRATRFHRRLPLQAPRTCRHRPLRVLRPPHGVMCQALGTCFPHLRFQRSRLGIPKGSCCPKGATNRSPFCRSRLAAPRAKTCVCIVCGGFACRSCNTCDM